MSLEKLQVRVNSEWLQQLPLDLYVPPAAFEILLDHFEGPLDFLLYLVKKTGFNLLNIDIAPIATQYLQYISQMQQHDVELASEYLVMAALLADLKSKLLLPKSENSLTADDIDPRLSLIARLEAYTAIKQGASHLNERNVLDRDVFIANTAQPEVVQSNSLETFDKSILSSALVSLLSRPKLSSHQVAHEAVSLEMCIQHICTHLDNNQPQSFYQLFPEHTGRLGVVTSFMAVLELIRTGYIIVIHNENDLILRKSNNDIA